MTAPGPAGPENTGTEETCTEMTGTEQTGTEMTSSRRLKPLTLLASLAVSGLTLLAWTMVWFVVTVHGSSTDAMAVAQPTLDVTGEVAAPALAALSLAGLALVAALAIAGSVVRVILGILQAAIGASAAWSAAMAMAAPTAASAPVISELTGVSGTESVAALVESISFTVWPILTLVFGVITVAIGVFVIVTGKRWPDSSRRYQPVRFDDSIEPRSNVSDWDSLSDGADPTSR